MFANYVYLAGAGWGGTGVLNAQCSTLRTHAQGQPERRA